MRSGLTSVGLIVISRQFVLAVAACGLSSLGLGAAQAAISVTSAGSPYTENFDTLANVGTSSILPAGWLISETGGNANTTYTAGTGSGNAGDTYSFGASGSTERALGGLQSGSLVPTIGAIFTNDIGVTITTLTINYVGEGWRLGASGRGADSILFEYSLDASGLSDGTWTSVSTLTFSTPNTGGAIGALDGNAAANRTAISATLANLNIGAGQTFLIRFVDFNVAGADDGLAVDDFSLTAGVGGVVGGDDTVPEPSSWSLMIIGFTLLSAAMRTRNAQPRLR